MLRATYDDATQSLAVTVGVAVLPGPAAASASLHALPGQHGNGSRPGVRAVSFRRTPVARFGNRQRQLSSVQRAGPYLVFTTVGYADGRRRVHEAANLYATAEMTRPGRRGRRRGGPPPRGRPTATGVPGRASVLARLSSHGGRTAGRRPAGGGRRVRAAARLAGAVLAAAGLCAVTVLPAQADAVRDQEMWVLDMVHAPSAWPVTQGQGVLVAVIDSGVLPSVSDLAGSVTEGPNLSGVNTPQSNASWGVHGTWMASLIAGHGHGDGSSRHRGCSAPVAGAVHPGGDRPG